LIGRRFSRSKQNLTGDGGERGAGRWLLTLASIGLIVLSACGGEPADSGMVPPAREVSVLTAMETPEAPDLGTPTLAPSPASPMPPATPAGSPVVTPPEEPTPTNNQGGTNSTAAAPLTLAVLSPQDGTGVEVTSLRVLGTTSGDNVQINSLPIPVAGDGTFQQDLTLQQGVNLLEVVASDDHGQTRSQRLVVFSVTASAGLPFTLLHPGDGLEVSQSTVQVVGVTALDAVVGVNEIPTEVSELGIFSSTVELEEGANLIEVVAADLSGNVRFQTVVVFYTP